MSEWHGKEKVSVRDHARSAGEMYLRFCQAQVDYPWANFTLERDSLWDEYCSQYEHPASSAAACNMAEAEAYFGLRSGMGNTFGAFPHLSADNLSATSP